MRTVQNALRNDQLYKMVGASYIYNNNFFILEFGSETNRCRGCHVFLMMYTTNIGLIFASKFKDTLPVD